jgi:NTE family protein
MSDVTPHPAPSLREPVSNLVSDTTNGLEDGIGLCLSGGGYRAMLFHVGALWRLNEAAILSQLKRVSSVSGGSITAGWLGLQWDKLNFAGNKGVGANFQKVIADPIRNLAHRTIDAESIISGVLLPGSVADKVTNAYEKYLFGDAKLANLPDCSQNRAPHFILNSTNVQTGSLWRFSRPYMGDYQVGLIRNPDLSLATAVAASSAFPPVLSPLSLDVDPAEFDPKTAGKLCGKPYNDEVVLSDGGVYDNMGLETVWKNYKTVLVSDAGMKMAPDPEPKGDWARHSMRILNMIDNQVRSLRKRQLIDSYDRKDRSGTYWGIRSCFGDYNRKPPPMADRLGIANFDPTTLATIPTRLKRMADEQQELLINWGYAIADAGLRKHGAGAGSVADPVGLPYPNRRF